MRERIMGIIEKDDLNEKEFNEIALEIFEYQYKKNKFYKIFCNKKGISPKNIKYFKEIPPCPQMAFKYFNLTTLNPEKAKYCFLSSGTTINLRSKRFIFYPEIYDKVIYKTFKKFFLPDMEKIKIFVFFPDFKELRNSSLAYMFKKIFEKFGKKGSMYVNKNGKYLFKEFIRKVKDIDEPVALLGTSLSFYYLIKYMKENKIQIKLPEFSRILDTGGFKGLKITINQDNLYNIYSNFLGIDKNFIVNEYGMCELISHYYDVNLKLYFEGRSAGRFKFALPFLKWKIVEPDNLRERKEGILVHYDLCSFDSCIAILTEDKAVKFKDGFILKGRVESRDLRGCSLISEP